MIVNNTPGVSVIMPTFNHANFITRALESLLEQTFENWELIIINDGSGDNTQALVSKYLNDDRIRYYENSENNGLGFCLNQGIFNARHDLIAYLPTDDVYYKHHLESLVTKYKETPDAALVYSGVRHHYNRYATGIIENYRLQLVQVMHKKTTDRWMERKELVTDDLDRMYWSKLRASGPFEGTGDITCEWVDHPHQWHKVIQEPIGGINPYKQRYNVKHPLRFHSTMGNFIDEVSYYQPFRTRVSTPAKEGLKILLVGELAYNAERILAFEEQGHKLYGLWMKDPYWYNFVGPLPFGNITDIPRENWEEKVKEIKPDVIYALLNWQAVPFAHEVMSKVQDIPFVWHFKEGPFICLEKGMWSELIDLHTKSDAQIYSSPEMREWFEQFLPIKSNSSFVLDGDLPKIEWFKNEQSALLSETDGDIHTVVPGRPIGLHPHTVAELGKNKIHLHFYGDFTHGQWKEWIKKTLTLAPGYLHIHSNCSQDNWVKEFSQYDAGWLHFFKSENNGEIMRANWDDLNYPARMATLAVAGLPMLQRDNTAHIVATQTLVQQHELGVLFKDIDDLAYQLNDKRNMKKIRNNVWEKRKMFSFDYHVNDLVQFFKEVIKKKKSGITKLRALEVQV